MISKDWKITLFVTDRENKETPMRKLLDEDEMYVFARDISRDINEKYYIKVTSSKVEEVVEND